jgi:hypothetical protein
VSLIVDIEMVNCCCFVAIINRVSMSISVAVVKKKVSQIISKMS